jgi:predicted RNA-binding Zn ribbon-like protein
VNNLSRGYPLVTVKRPPAIFIARDAALDFLNSVATPVDVPIDWLDDGEGLLAWLAQAELVPGAVLRQIRSRSSISELDKVAEQARALRAWFRSFVERHRGHPLAREELKSLERLNRLLERGQSFTRIVAAAGDESGTFELRTLRKWHAAEALLFPIAEALARFVCAKDFTYIKACAGPTCTLLFLDDMRTRPRRWCSMAICGNRSKQAAHRHRVKLNG